MEKEREGESSSSSEDSAGVNNGSLGVGRGDCEKRRVCFDVGDVRNGRHGRVRSFCMLCLDHVEDARSSSMFTLVSTLNSSSSSSSSSRPLFNILDMIKYANQFAGNHVVRLRMSQERFESVKGR